METLKVKNEIPAHYIQKYWVGLMDGDGSIQVNHWRKKNLQYRLIIKLKFHILNEIMLKLIASEIGGFVRSYPKNDKKKWVLWVINDKKKIKEVIKIYEKYPPLTKKSTVKLAFLKECLKKNDINWYFDNKDFFYNKEISFKEQLFIFNNCNYFEPWLSGFIEAEASFHISERGDGVKQFNIAQKNEEFIITKIKDYFKSNNKVQKTEKTSLYKIDIYNREILINIINHCTKYPLLGQKLESFLKFKNTLSTTKPLE